MATQQKTENQSDNTRDASTDPLGADAALRAGGSGASGSQSAAEPAELASHSASAGGASYGTTRRVEDYTGARTTGGDMMASASSAGTGAVHATRDVLRGAIGATEDLASNLVGGVTHVATDLVHGVREVGVQVGDGATGLIGAAGAVGGTVVHTVAGLLVEVVGGVRHVLHAAMGNDGNNGRARAELGVSGRPAYTGGFDDQGQDSFGGQSQEAIRDVDDQERSAMRPPTTGKRSGVSESRA